MSKGLFITLEGGEGSGKTSVMLFVKEFLESRGLQVKTTREPGGIPIAEQIRSVILDVENTEMDEWTEALLYTAARRQHLVEVILPNLKKGVTVLCDRFIDSSLVYQGYVRGLGVDYISVLNLFATRGLFPDLTLWMDVTPEEGLRRINANSGREVNRLDLESVNFHKKVQEGYRRIQKKYPERIVRVDADQSLEGVYKDIKIVLETFLEKISLRDSLEG